jgi:uncharacterized protein YbcI
MVSAKARRYGRGPTRARTYFDDEYVFVVMEGGLTASEEALVAAGEEGLVRQYRLRFEEVTSDELAGVIQEITGRTVVGHQSQITFDPPRIFEICELDAAPEAGRV